MGRRTKGARCVWRARCLWCGLVGHTRLSLLALHACVDLAHLDVTATFYWPTLPHVRVEGAFAKILLHVCAYILSCGACHDLQSSPLHPFTCSPTLSRRTLITSTIRRTNREKMDATPRFKVTRLRPLHSLPLSLSLAIFARMTPTLTFALVREALFLHRTFQTRIPSPASRRGVAEHAPHLLTM
jgi:hypothetical protein